MDKKLGFFDLKLSEKIGNMFEYAVSNKNFDIYDFLPKWLQSKTFFNILSWDISLVSQSPTYILGNFADELKKENIEFKRKKDNNNKECINWIGYVTTYWCIRDSVTGDDILSNYNIEKIINNAEIYHSLSISVAIELIQQDAKKEE